ncbi:hypothetical protein HXX76_003616 [Chlamydomonas incerta]|uniref:Chitinase n=1 Tax=Chlamydomonas incerta TaxID=51695 RepID=A0A835W823_CHLIN|nr:hypothetical protein HXX76_003616 [Chlamydomonas incerta]|eukprot:KAG2440759.1 hypothetical protein HXX76_003616 [Chlamydomonas incerta]
MRAAKTDYLTSNSPGGIVVSQLVCNGNEQRISGCTSYASPYVNPEALSKCTVVQAAGVRCYEADFSVRLINDAPNNQTSATTEGRLEVWVDKGWGLVGESGAVVIAGGAYPYGERPAGMNVVVDDLKCRGDETSLGLCDRGPVTNPNVNAVSIQCREGDFAVRLALGEHPSEGRLEVYLNGTWSTVCSDRFDRSAMFTVCRQLGYATSNDLGPSFTSYNATSLPQAPRPDNSTLPALIRLASCPDGAMSISMCGVQAPNPEPEDTDIYECSSASDVVVQCYQVTPLVPDVEPRALCNDPWSTGVTVVPSRGSTTMLIGELDDTSDGPRAQDALLVSYQNDGTLVGHVAFGSPWSSDFSSQGGAVTFGATARPGGLLLADVTGDGRDDLVALFEDHIKVSTASGASSFSPLSTWLDLSTTTDLRIDTSNTTTRGYLFIDVTGDNAADMVFFDRQVRRLAYYPSDGIGAFTDDTDGDGTTWFELSSINARCTSLGEDCFLLTTDVNGDGLPDVMLSYLERIMDDREVYQTFVAISPPAPLTWHLAAPAYFPRGACTSPWDVVAGQFVGVDGPVDGSSPGTSVPQMACLSSYDSRVYVAGLGIWGVLPDQPTQVYVRDVNADGRSDLIIFTALGSYYMISTGSSFQAPISTAQFDVPSTTSVPTETDEGLGQNDETESTVVASGESIGDAPVEQRCGAPQRVVVYFSNRRPDATTPGCTQTTGANGEGVLSRAAAATHVIFTYARPSADGYNVSFASERDRVALANLDSSLNAINPAIKVLMSVGGPGNDLDFSRIVLNPQSIEMFAGNMVDILTALNLDGLELSWPALSLEQLSNYYDLIEMLSSYMKDAGLLLALSVPPTETYLSMPWYLTVDFFDLINFQAFDVAGDEVLGAAPYIETPLFDCLEATGLSVNTLLDAVLASGAPPQRISLILPAMGRSFLLDGEGWVGGPGSAGPCMGTEGLLNRAELRLLLPPGGSRLDASAFALYSPYGNNGWAHFDDPFTVSNKVCYARSHCLGGVGLWDVDSDSFGELLDTIAANVPGDPAACRNYFPPECTNLVSSAGTEQMGPPEVVATLGQSEYQLFQIRKTWADARAHCQAVGGDLASVKRGGEAGVVYSLLNTWASSGQLGDSDVYSGRDVFVWLGGSDAAQEGRFVWVDTESDFTFTAWAEGQPDGRYGGEDCLAASVRLAGSSGAGLRSVVSGSAEWSDLGCSITLPFVCKRPALGDAGLLVGAKTVPWLMNEYVVLAPENEGEPGLMRTMAEANKLCRSFGGELPSLTDLWARAEVTTTYHRDLPSHFWLGLRSYGDGQLYWSDGTYSVDGLLSAWEPGEFGDAACSVVVGPQGINLTMEYDRLYSKWNSSATGGAVIVSPPPPPPPTPEPPSEPPPSPVTPLAPFTPFPPPPGTSRPPLRPPGAPPPPVEVPPDSPPEAPSPPDFTNLYQLSQGVYSLSCLERMPVVCQMGRSAPTLTPTFYCLTRPNGLAYMVPGEQLEGSPQYVESELACGVACMINPTCVYYTYLPNAGPPSPADPSIRQNTCHLMSRPWTSNTARSFLAKTLAAVTSTADRVCFRTDSVFSGDALPIASDGVLEPAMAASPLFGSPSTTNPTSANPLSYSLMCSNDGPSPIIGNLSLGYDVSTFTLQDIGMACTGQEAGMPHTVYFFRSANVRYATGDCSTSGVQGISGSFDSLGICQITVTCGNGAVRPVLPPELQRPCAVGGSFDYQCPERPAASTSTLAAAAVPTAAASATTSFASHPTAVSPDPSSSPPFAFAFAESPKHAGAFIARVDCDGGCARVPADWCLGGGYGASRVDCDQDGYLDWLCTDGTNFDGVLDALCLDTSGNYAPRPTCPTRRGTLRRCELGPTLNCPEPSCPTDLLPAAGYEMRRHMNPNCNLIAKSLTCGPTIIYGVVTFVKTDGINGVASLGLVGAAVDLGEPGAAPYYLDSFTRVDARASWIWSNNLTMGQTVSFYRTIVNGATTKAWLYIAVYDVADIWLNNAYIGTVEGGYIDPANSMPVAITMMSGTNLLRIHVTSYPPPNADVPGLIASVQRADNGVVIAHTDSTWLVVRQEACASLPGFSAYFANNAVSPKICPTVAGYSVTLGSTHVGDDIYCYPTMAETLINCNNDQLCFGIARINTTRFCNKRSVMPQTGGYGLCLYTKLQTTQAKASLCRPMKGFVVHVDKDVSAASYPAGFTCNQYLYSVAAAEWATSTYPNAVGFSSSYNNCPLINMSPLVARDGACVYVKGSTGMYAPIYLLADMGII